MGMAFLGLVSCLDEPRSGPIVLIIVDTLRADHLPCYGYGRPTAPETCALANDGVLFERAYTPRTATTPAIASMLTGLYPHRHGVESLYQVLPESAHTLPERLREQGFRTAAFVSSFVMVDDFSGFAQGFETYDDALTKREAFRENFERSATETIDRALAWLEDAGPHTFLMVHLIEPHGPYTPSEQMGVRFALPRGGLLPTDIPDYQTIPELRYVSEYVGLYDAEIADVDVQVGRLVDGIRNLGMYEGATLIFTSDHGESLGEDGMWFRHGRSVHDAEGHVPLIVKFGLGRPEAPPGGTRVAVPVSVVDIFRTALADAALVSSDVAGVSQDLLEVATSSSPAPPPITQRPLRHTFLVAAHGSECSGRWDVPQVEDARDAASWLEHSKVLPHGSPDAAAEGSACLNALGTAVGPRVQDLLSYRRDFNVVRRRGVDVPGFRTRFLQQRGDHILPLDEREMERLRSLGYVR